MVRQLLTRRSSFLAPPPLHRGGEGEELLPGSSPLHRAGEAWGAPCMLWAEPVDAFPKYFSPLLVCIWAATRLLTLKSFISLHSTLQFLKALSHRAHHRHWRGRPYAASRDCHSCLWEAVVL